jgi:hypothetical protein
MPTAEEKMDKIIEQNENILQMLSKLTAILVSAQTLPSPYDDEEDEDDNEDDPEHGAALSDEQMEQIMAIAKSIKDKE